MSKPPPPSPRKTSSSSSWLLLLLLSFILPPLLATVLVYKLDSFHPAALPLHELTHPPLHAPFHHSHLLLHHHHSHYLGRGDLVGPEDIAYDPKSGLLYTGCADGWIKRVRINKDSSPPHYSNSSIVDVEPLFHTGGRPLGLVFGHHNELIVADAFQGLLNVSKEGGGGMKLLSKSAEGMRFNLTDAVDIAEDGKIYFTDASYKYNLDDFIWDILEGKPHGRLLCFDPSTTTTHVLARNLYFPNGLAVSPDQNSIVFCETPMRRCRRYYIQGKKKGSIEKFINNLPGLPDNIHYAHGHYWIGIATETTVGWDLAFRYPVIRKVMGIMTRYKGGERALMMEKGSGVFVVDGEGNPTAHYSDPSLQLISTGFPIGNHLYMGSLLYPYLLRFNLTPFPPSTTY